jgi:hypothetical protein
VNEFAEHRFVKVMRDAPQHRKFRKMARILGIKRQEAFGIAVELWVFCDMNFPFGVLDGLDAEGIADSLGVDHIDPDDLLNGLLEAGLVDDTPEGIAVHGWMDDGRSGASALKRSQWGRALAHKRWHMDDPSPECDLCIAQADEDASLHSNTHAPLHPEAYNEASISMQDKRRETQDERRETSKIALKEEERARVYAADDPERPFVSVVRQVAAP